MLKVTITTYNSGITVQDPKPVTATSADSAVVSMVPNETKEMIMQWGQLERIQSQLSDLAALGVLSFVIEPVGIADGVAEFAEQPGNMDAPAIDGFSNGAAATITAVGDTFDIIGDNLMGGQVQAGGRLLSILSTAYVQITLLNPGHAGNLYDLQIVDSGAGGLAVTSTLSATTGRTLVEVDLGGSATETVTGVTAAVDAVISAVALVTAVGVGTTVISALQAVTPLTGGIGTGISIKLGGLVCTLDAVDISAAPVAALTVTSPDLTAAPVAFAAADVVQLKVRSNEKEATLSAVLA